ncbi:acyl-CoA dehydrogenase family protein [Ferrimonas pelagia]|uniref:Acyl-CoA dehydrogenase family protein n=1 Tax=Ferrimonas pelagia TaxID=1177826 RepID=A0ABP9ER21_9GAMM
MEFAFTEEQVMIRDTAEGYLAELSSSEAVRSAMATEQGYLPDTWQRLCEEMYWQALTIPEEFGGLGLGYVELAVVLEQMGRRLLCSPFYATVCLATPALLLSGSDEQKAFWLPQIAEGSLTATLAYTGSNRWDASAVTAIARPEGDGFVLEGELKYVPNGHSADLLIVAARLEGSSGEQGVSLFAVPADSAGVERRWTPTMDQTRPQGTVQLSQCYVGSEALLGKAGEAWPVLESVLQLAAIAQAAEQTGGAQQCLDITVDYLQERQQFGRVIASFQAIKHRCADMMVQVECARSAVYYAACVAQEFLEESGDSEGLGAELPQAAALAKGYCSDAFFDCAAESIQLHGGVGFTWEYDPHLYFKRAKSSETFLGSAAMHREAIATHLLGE